MAEIYLVFHSVYDMTKKHCSNYFPVKNYCFAKYKNAKRAQKRDFSKKTWFRAHCIQSTIVLKLRLAQKFSFILVEMVMPYDMMKKVEGARGDIRYTRQANSKCRM